MVRGDTSVLLSLDVSSTSTGYSVIRKGRFNKSVRNYGKITPDKKNTLCEKLSFFRSELIKILNKYKPTAVAIEDVFVGRISSAIILSRFSGVAIETVYSNTGIEPILMEATRVRKILGAGRKKEDVFNYITNRFNLTDWDFSSYNDITDSIGLGLAIIKEEKDGKVRRQNKGTSGQEEEFRGDVKKSGGKKKKKKGRK